MGIIHYGNSKDNIDMNRLIKIGYMNDGSIIYYKVDDSSKDYNILIHPYYSDKALF